MSDRKFPLVATDIILSYKSASKEGIVLIERKNPPYGLALPGGMAEYGISLEENAVKEALEETGLEAVIENAQHPICVMSDPKRDPRYHIISVAFFGKGYGRLMAGDDAKDAKLYSIDEVVRIVAAKKLVLDHNEIMREYLALRCGK